MHTDGWRLVALEDGSLSSSGPEDQGLTESLNFSQLVGGQSGQNTCRVLLFWPYVQWRGRAPLVRSVQPAQRHCTAESSAGTERSRHALPGCICSRHETRASTA